MSHLHHPIMGMLAAALAAASLAQPSQSAERYAAVVVTPARGAKVKSTHTMAARVQTRGQPVVLVRAETPGSLWWVQQPVQITGPQTFQAKLRFGNDRTPDGTTFLIVVLMAQNGEEAAAFSPEQPMKLLPAGIPRSAEWSVVLEREAAESTLAGLIQAPENNATVSRIQEIGGRLASGGVPIVLVRAGETNSPWWVQDVAHMREDGQFTAKARFGNDATPAGTAFHVIVILAENDEKAAQFPVGSTVAELPQGLPQSEERVVRLGNPPASQ